MERALGSGKMRIISFFDDVRVLTLGEDELRRVDPDLVSFTNVNTPKELEVVRSRAGGRP